MLYRMMMGLSICIGLIGFQATTASAESFDATTPADTREADTWEADTMSGPDAGGDALTSCQDVSLCVDDCQSGSQDCIDACLERGTESAASNFDAIYQCTRDSECAGLAEEEYWSCLEENCSSEYETCYGMSPSAPDAGMSSDVGGTNGDTTGMAGDTGSSGGGDAGGGDIGGISDVGSGEGSDEGGGCSSTSSGAPAPWTLLVAGMLIGGLWRSRS